MVTSILHATARIRSRGGLYIHVSLIGNIYYTEINTYTSSILALEDNLTVAFYLFTTVDNGKYYCSISLTLPVNLRLF